ncbi:hypothetical protein Q8A73_022267 [Channa argus]|nr:hypothetical protein Q8A73_022267 [Channa argus]
MDSTSRWREPLVGSNLHRLMLQVPTLPKPRSRPSPSHVSKDKKPLLPLPLVRSAAIPHIQSHPPAGETRSTKAQQDTALVNCPGTSVPMCQEAARQDAIHQFTHESEERNPTWLEHTLEIKDDQNKGSQTSGKYHPAYPAHPHHFAQSLFHGGTVVRLEGAARFVRGGGGMKGRFVGSSAGTDEDCPLVNELNVSNTGRTTAGLWEGGGGEGNDGVMAPRLVEMGASRLPPSGGCAQRSGEALNPVQHTQALM